MRSGPQLIVAAIAVAAMAACERPLSAAEIESKAKEATASALPDLAPDKIEIRNFERGAAKASWEVVAGSDIYACDSDEILRLPACRKL
jgi:hypothetical protein